MRIQVYLTQTTIRSVLYLWSSPHKIIRPVRQQIRTVLGKTAGNMDSPRPGEDAWPWSQGRLKEKSPQRSWSLSYQEHDHEDDKGGLCEQLTTGDGRCG